ncbi:MAG: ribonuclease R [bacterium]
MSLTPPDSPDVKAVLDLLAREGRPMSVREMVRHLGLPASERPLLRRKLRALAEEGGLIRVRARYALPQSLSIERGVFRGHRQGYGFVIPEGEGGGEAGADIFIRRSRTRGAMDGDRVSARAERVHPDGRREGSVLEVIERAHATLVGRLEVEGRRAWVEPQSQRIPHLVHLDQGGRGGARAGEWVEVEITRYPGFGEEPRGRVVRAFGYPEDPAVEQSMIIAKHGLREEFGEKALREAEASRPPEEGDPFPAGVEDLRGLAAFTIDPRTARDRDDALSIETLPEGGCRLGVHIADVSHYVSSGSALDREAYRRGNSVYFPDRAIPMLPPKLSGEVCSLEAGKVRRTLSIFLDFDGEGRRTDSRLAVGRIRSRAELTYHAAGALLEGRAIPEEELGEAPSLERELRALASLAESLRARRMAEGGLDFELPEAVVRLDAEGKPEAIESAPRNAAHRLVEECMLAANRAVAERLAGAGGGAVYRVHEPPDEEKLPAVRLALSNLRLPVPSAEALKQPGALQSALEAARGTDYERYVNLLVLRCMKLAVYAPAPALHFGLGFPVYTHFTSPIRRYADLLVHRRLTRLLRGARREPYAKRRAESCAHISAAERAAEEAERDMVDFHKALFMKDRVGERFGGHVSGAASFGVFVELEDIFVEGMIPLAALTDDYYRFLPEEHAVLGERTGRRFRLGDPVTVRVVGVDLAQREIALQLLAGGSRGRAEGESGAGRSKRALGTRRPQGGAKGGAPPGRRKKAAPRGRGPMPRKRGRKR